jgi:oxygen-independent coproporphyrinogen-3 oxidase
MAYSLYVHIPFCTNICSFCNFCRLNYSESLVDDYLVALEKEVSSLNLNPENIYTLYFGGGSPSSLNIKQLNYLKKIFLPFKNAIEITFEANSEDLNVEKIQVLKEIGVNRVSLGVQTFENESLELLNRKSDYKQIANTIQIFKENYITNINLDLLFGIPNSSIEKVKLDLEKIFSLKPNHISLYPLEIRNSKLATLGYSEATDIELANTYKMILKLAKTNKFIHYETSNISLKGFESKHNLVYWKNDNYYAVGLSAVGKIDNVRTANTKNIIQYLKGENYQNIETLNEMALQNEYVMLNFRTKNGIILSDYMERFQKDFLEEFKDVILKKTNYLILKKKSISIKEKYWFVSNMIIVDFMVEEK